MKYLWLVLICLFNYAQADDAIESINIAIDKKLQSDIPLKSKYYFKLMSALLPPEYKLNFAYAEYDSKRHDIYIGINQDITQDISISEFHINMTYPLYALFDQERIKVNRLEDLSNLSIAILSTNKSLEGLPALAQVYDIASVEEVDKLVLRKRVDVALVHSYNLHIANPELRLAQQLLINAQKVTVSFNQSKPSRDILKSLFEDGFLALRDDEKLASFYRNKSDFFHADVAVHTGSHEFFWQLYPKTYNTKLKRLEPIDREILFSQHIQKLLPDYRFTSKVNRVAIIDQQLASTDNTCSLGLSARNDRASFSYLSTPVHVFIPPRLFMLSDNFDQKTAKNILTLAPQSLANLLKNSDMKIAVRAENSYMKSIEHLIPEELREKIFFIDEKSYQNIGSLLALNHIDAVIEWPSRFHELIKPEISKKLISITLKEILSPAMYTYINCSKSQAGKLLIEKINAIILKPSHQQQLYSPYVESLDTQSAARYKHLLGLTF